MRLVVGGRRLLALLEMAHRKHHQVLGTHGSLVVLPAVVERQRDVLPDIARLVAHQDLHAHDGVAVHLDIRAERVPVPPQSTRPPERREGQDSPRAHDPEAHPEEAIGAPETLEEIGGRCLHGSAERRGPRGEAGQAGRTTLRVGACDHRPASVPAGRIADKAPASYSPVPSIPGAATARSRSPPRPPMAWCCAMTRRRTSRSRAVLSGKSRGMTGSPTRTRAVPRRTSSLAFGFEAAAPEMATGTTGTPASMATTNGPFLKGWTVASALRVPSGKTMRLVPSRMIWPARLSAATACARSRRSTEMKRASARYHPKIGIRKSSRLAMNRTLRGMAQKSNQTSSALSWFDT